MQRRESSSEQETQQQNQLGEWLNLSLGRNPSKALEKQEYSQSELSSRGASLIRVYSCNFCRRKFYSSQALGGHQNAHRRERSLLGSQNYEHAYDMMTMMNLPNHTTSMCRSLGVQQHSHIHKPPSRDGTATSSRFREAHKPSSLEEAADLMWRGSFRSHPQQPEQISSNSDMLDLNLKL